MSIGSKPINPNPTNVFTLDIESSHLYFHDFFTAKYKDGKFELPDISRAAEAYKPSVPLQFGIHREGGKIKHIALNDAYTLFMPKELVQSDPMNFVSRDGGRTVRGVMGKTQYHTREELYDYLSSEGSKLDKRKVDYYMDNVAWHYLGKDQATTVTTEVGGKKLNLSKFSFDKFVLNNTPEGIRQAVVNQGVHYHTMDFNKFINSGEAESLADHVTQILKAGTQASPSEIRAWNAPFDINYIRSILYHNGNQKLQVAFDAAVNSGQIVVNSVERDWQLIAYNLIKDDPEAAAKVTIGYSPAAARETGRMGQAMRSFTDFQHSTVSWSQDNVSSYMKWYGKIADLGEQTHFAGPDVKLTGYLHEAFQKIKTEALAASHQAGFTFGTFEDLALSDKGSGVITEAINTIMKGETTKQLGTSAKGLREDILKDAVKTGEWYKKNFAGFFASKLQQESQAKWIAKYGKKYAAPAAAIGGILALTYMNIGSESEIDEFKHGIRGTAKTNGKESWGSHRYIDREAHYKSHVFKAMASGIAAPFGVLYAVGLNTAMNKNPKFFKEGIGAKNIFEHARNVMRTAAYGARTIESNFPITRLFGVSAISDFMLGSRRTSELTGKADVFKVVRDGKIQTLGLEFDQLLKEVKVSNPDKFDQLRDILRPQKLNRDLEKRTIRIQRQTTGGTKVFWDDTYKVVDQSVAGGQSIGKPITGSMHIDLETRVTNIRTIDSKYIGSAARKKMRAELEMNPFAKSKIVNPLMYESGKEYASQNLFSKVSFSEYLKGSHMPQGVMANAGLGKLWNGMEFVKYSLDIGSKGIGEGRDLFSPASTRMLSNTEKIIQVTGHSKDPFGADSARLVYGRLKHVMR